MKYIAWMVTLGSFVVASTADYSNRKPETLRPVGVPSVSHGNTRITLIHLGRTTSWSNQFVHGHDNQQGPMYAIPGVYLEFLVERLDEPSTAPKFNESTIKLTQNGRLIRASSPVIGGGDGGIEQYSLRSQQFGFNRPVVANKDKAFIICDYRRGLSLKAGVVTIRFEAGFDQENHVFEFNDIPLY